MKAKVDVFTQHYFTYPFIVLGVIFLLMAILLSLMIPVLSIILLLLGLVTTTTHYRLQIDTKQKLYWDYLWILGLKKGTKRGYENFDHIYFNRLERSSEYGLVARLSATKTVYQGYIKLSDGETIFFGESNDEKVMLKKGKKLIDVLRIDMNKNY